MNAITSVQIEYHTSEYVNAALRPKRSEIPAEDDRAEEHAGKAACDEAREARNANGEDDVAVKSPARIKPSEM